MKGLSNMKNSFDEYFTAGMIAEILKLNVYCVYKRIKFLELYPIAINGSVKYYHHSVIEHIRENKPNSKYLVFQSKINNPNFEI
jgi:hypothetical protein